MAITTTGGLTCAGGMTFSVNGFSTPALMNGITAYNSMTAVAVNSSGLFVAVGYDVNGYPVYATSSDGTTWTTPGRINGNTPTILLGVTVYNTSGKFVTVGETDTSNVSPSYSVYTP